MNSLASLSDRVSSCNAFFTFSWINLFITPILVSVISSFKLSHSNILSSSLFVFFYVSSDNMIQTVLLLHLLFFFMPLFVFCMLLNVLGSLLVLCYIKCNMDFCINLVFSLLRFWGLAIFHLSTWLVLRFLGFSWCWYILFHFGF